MGRNKIVNTGDYFKGGVERGEVDDVVIVNLFSQKMNVEIISFPPD
jgi:hypothetical protein